MHNPLLGVVYPTLDASLGDSNLSCTATFQRQLVCSTLVNSKKFSCCTGQVVTHTHSSGKVSLSEMCAQLGTTSLRL